MDFCLAESWWDKKVEDLSKGMSQKLQFVTTVLHEPKLIILDEPFSGLDPVNANLIKDEIFSLAKKGSKKYQAKPPKTQAFGSKAFGSSNNTTLRWLGMAGFLINSRGTNIMIDPLLEGFDMPMLIDFPIAPKDDNMTSWNRIRSAPPLPKPRARRSP